MRTALLPFFFVGALIALAGIATGALLGQPAPEPADGTPGAPDSRLYKKPFEVVNPDSIARAEQELANPDPDYTLLVQLLAREINAYTTQFIEDKRILDERRTAPSRPEQIDKNTLRLITLLQKQKYGKIQFLGESPYMNTLHRLLGQSYEALDRPYRALSEYSMAFRYTSFEQPWRELNTDEEREDRYLLMLRGFAHPDRVQEERDPRVKQDAERFRDLLEQYNRLKIQEREAIKFIDVERARVARGEGGNVGTARQRAQTLGTRLRGVERRLEGIRLGSYRKYHTEKSMRDGDLAYRMAVLVKRLETENKKVARILNRSSFYRGLGDQLGEERTAFRNFVGFQIFLELAHKLDPNNLRYISLLSEEYQNGRRKQRAIAFTERYIELAEKTQPKPRELADHYLRLGGLFTDSKNYIRATQAYERYLALLPDGPISRETRLALADLYFERTGNFPRARELYNRFLDDTRNIDLNTLGYRPKANLQNTRYRIFRNLASIDRRQQRWSREEGQLVSAREEFYTMEGDFKKFQEERVGVQQRINEVKRQLLGKEDQELQAEYYRLLRISLPEVTERADYLRIRLESMNLPAVLERLALIEQRDRNFQESLDLYREIITRGSGEQATRARQNISLVNLTLTDGRLRDPVLPPNFER